MQRRIQAQRQDTVAYQTLVDHKQATQILSQNPNISTFAQPAELIGYSHESVRQRLMRAPEKLYKNHAFSGVRARGGVVVEQLAQELAWHYWNDLVIRRQRLRLER